jgi:hypothetical protein
MTLYLGSNSPLALIANGDLTFLLYRDTIRTVVLGGIQGERA